MGEINKESIITIVAGQIDSNVLKDSMGRFRTRSLFVETCGLNDIPIYTLKDEGELSAYKHFINSRTEYEAAIKLVGSWRHWERLLECDWFLSGTLDGRPIAGFDGLLKWRQELELKTKAFAINVLLDAANNGDTSAAKILLKLEEKENKIPKLKKKDIKEAEDSYIGRQSLLDAVKRLS